MIKKKGEILKSTETTLNSKKCSQEDSIFELPLDNGSLMIEKGKSDHLRRSVEVFASYIITSAKGVQTITTMNISHLQNLNLL